MRCILALLFYCLLPHVCLAASTRPFAVSAESPFETSLTLCFSFTGLYRHTVSFTTAPLRPSTNCTYRLVQMVTIARPLDSASALRDATHHNVKPHLAHTHAAATTCSGIPHVPVPAPSPYSKPAPLNVLNTNVLLDPGIVRAHASLLLAEAYGENSPSVLFPTPKVIATQPSSTDFRAELIGKGCDKGTYRVLESPGVMLDGRDDMKVRPPSLSLSHERSREDSRWSSSTRLCSPCCLSRNDGRTDAQRNLDISSLPLNPVTGSAPTVDSKAPMPVDSYKHQSAAAPSPKPSSLPTPPHSSLPMPPKMLDSATTAINGKKARLSPLASPRQPSQPTTMPFTPGVTATQPSIPGVIQTGNGPVPLHSPMHFGGPLTPNSANRVNGGLTVPSTPVVGMMPGMMSYGMGNFGNMVRRIALHPTASTERGRS